ncbi:MAG TPA: 30S ribosomal protein S6 [Chthoniobacterales bacterium]
MSKKRYETLLALDTRGKEDSAKDIIERLEKELEAEGLEIEQVQRLENRELSYEHAHQKNAYFVNVVFSAEPAIIAKLRAKFKLDAEIGFFQFLSLPAKKEVVAA